MAIVSCVLASVRIPPRIGPRQGVHPAPKAIPTRKAPSTPSGFSLRCTRDSIWSAGILITPIETMPKKMITTPPIRPRRSFLAASAAPSAVAPAPRRRKMVVKPSTNSVDCTIATRRRSVISATFIPVTKPR